MDKRVLLRSSLRGRRRSVAAEAARRVDRLEFGEVEIADRLQRVGRRAVLQVGRQCLQPGGVLGLQVVVSSATVSCQRRARLRWSAGRRVRMTGSPAARAARWRAWRSASVMAGRRSACAAWFHSQSLRHETTAQTDCAQARFLKRQLSLPVSTMSQ